MYYWINAFVGGVLYVFCMGMFWSFLLNSRFVKFPKWFICGIYTAIAFIPGIIRSISNENSFLFSAMEVIELLLIAIFLLFCFKDKWWKKVLALVLYLVIANISEGIVFPLFDFVGVHYTPNFDTYEMFILQTTTCILSLGLSFIIVILWNKIEKNTVFPKFMWIFLVFPISQILMVWNSSANFLSDKSDAIFTVVGCILAFVSDIYMFYTIIEQGEKEEMSRKIQQLEVLRVVEEKHYNAIQERRDELAKIRHDYNNQITTILNLIKNGSSDDAQVMLEQLHSSISLTKENIWCRNSIINAVISEKTIICEKMNIHLITDIILDDDLKISPIHLCSVISNLFDNAINATSLCDIDNRCIEIKGRQHGDYITFRFENTYNNKEQKEKQRRKSYGLEILQDIATQYKGALNISAKENRYISVISLEKTI